MKIKEYLEAQKKKRSCDLDDLAKRVEELEKINETSTDEEELKAAGAELDDLKAKKAEKEKELEEINAQIAELDKPDDEEEQPKRNLNFMKKEERNKMDLTKEELETRAAAFKEKGKDVINLRSTTISGGTLATPAGVDGINDQFNKISSIVDLVKVENCHGMGSNKIAYVVSGSSAAQQTEGNAIGTSDPTFAFVTIQPTSYGVLSYVTAQVKKQSPLDYEGKVKGLAMDALKIQMANVITAAVKASSLVTTVNATVASSKGVVNEKTLRNLVLAYGGSEGVEGNAWLFLNKTDLIAFGDVRGTQEKKAVYEIIPNATNPNVGQIKDGGLVVNYCINSNVDACNGTAQAATAKKTMFYGNPKNIECDLFGDYEIEVSADYKFAENMLSIRGTVDAGADIVHADGVVFLTIPATI